MIDKCLMIDLGAVNLMTTAIENVTFVDQTYCRYNEETESELFYGDVCCNSNLNV